MLPDYNFIYLGDNARTPYGTRSFETVYAYTWQCVHQLYQMGCPLVILACNTASAKALRSIQQQDLPNLSREMKALGVIRPTTEVIGNYTHSRHIGLLATQGTVASKSYVLEIERFFPDIRVYQEACPMWVPIVENNMLHRKGSEYFIEENVQHLLAQSPKIDAIILACTHYPLLLPLIRKFTPPHVKILSQGELVAKSLKDYLGRHAEIEKECLKEGRTLFFTTENPSNFNDKAGMFFGRDIRSEHLNLND